MEKKEIIHESEKIKKAREKLKRRLSNFEKHITPDNLKKKIIEIHDRIARHAPDRVVLKNKNISLFDNNQNAADLSNKVNLVAIRVRQESKIFMQSVTDLSEGLKKHIIISE